MMLPALTQVDEAHYRVGLADDGAERWRVRAEGRQRRVVDGRPPPVHAGPDDVVGGRRVVLGVHRHGVVEVQHEKRRRRRRPKRRVRPGSARQAQDGQDLFLHLFLLAAAQTPEAGVHCRLGLLGQRQEQDQKQDHVPGQELGSDTSLGRTRHHPASASSFWRRSRNSSNAGDDGSLALLFASLDPLGDFPHELCTEDDVHFHSCLR